MTKYRVSKCRGKSCHCRERIGLGWHVTRMRGLERAVMCTWLGHETALYAALEFGGLATPQEPAC